tara:strand:- start:386 stop:667 length:282 start_codon:yes stop_codon:yes gene_type:complete
MKYKIRKLSNLKRRNFFDTYEPEKRRGISKTDTLPLILRLGQRLVCLGGLISFWAVSGLMIIKGFFSAEERVKKTARKFSFNHRVVEFRIKKS